MLERLIDSEAMKVFEVHTYATIQHLQSLFDVREPLQHLVFINLNILSLTEFWKIFRSAVAEWSASININD